MKVLSEQEINNKLDRFSNLQSLPQVIVQIKRISENPNSSTADLANCILSDHQLTSRVLKMANSVFYGSYSGKISTVTRAILIMGFRPIRNIAISMGVYQLVNKLSKGGKFDIISFWIRSLGCGLIAKFLSERMKRPDLIEVAFIAGFMHDIGEPILAGAFPEEYDEIIKLKGGQLDAYKTEKIMLGIDHMTAGKYLTYKWNLPTELVKPIFKHHKTTRSADQKSKDVLIDLVYLADRIYPCLMNETSLHSSTYTALINKTRNLVNVSKRDMIDLLTECREKMVEIAEDLEVDIESQFENGALDEDSTDKMQNEINAKNMQLSFLHNATDELMEAKSSDEILQVLCEAIFRGLEMGRVILFRYDTKFKNFVGKVGFGMGTQEEIRSLSFSGKTGLFKEMIEKGGALSIDDENLEICDSLITNEENDRLEPLAFVIIPIKVLGKIRYALYIDGPNKAVPITEEALRSMVSLANQSAITLERNLFMAKLNMQKATP